MHLCGCSRQRFQAITRYANNILEYLHRGNFAIYTDRVYRRAMEILCNTIFSVMTGTRDRISALIERRSTRDQQHANRFFFLCLDTLSVSLLVCPCWEFVIIIRRIGRRWRKKEKSLPVRKRAPRRWIVSFFHIERDTVSRKHFA